MPELRELPRASIDAINGVGGQLRVAEAGPHRSGVSTIDVLQIGCPPLNVSLGPAAQHRQHDPVIGNGINSLVLL